MRLKKKTCFVISPIGSKESDIRKEADTLLWSINQAVKKHGFEITRIDEVSKTLDITKEIIQYVQEAELCVIILTGNNPNVFYEAGRRHQAGKPYIHLVREGEKLPFDVAAINTIHYDRIDTLEGAKDLVERIERFIEEMGSEVSAANASRATMESVAAALQRIEHRLSNLPSAVAPYVQRTTAGSSLFTNPREAFMLAVARGDLATAVSLLPRLQQLLGYSQELLNAAATCATGGSEDGVNLVFTILEKLSNSLSPEAIVQALGAVGYFYSITDREHEGIDKVSSLIDRYLKEVRLENHEKASFLNQKQRLLYGVKAYEEALAITEKILKLDPTNASYYYNASLIYEELKLNNKALEWLPSSWS